MILNEGQQREPSKGNECLTPHILIAAATLEGQSRAGMVWLRPESHHQRIAHCILWVPQEHFGLFGSCSPVLVAEFRPYEYMMNTYILVRILVQYHIEGRLLRLVRTS